MNDHDSYRFYRILLFYLLWRTTLTHLTTTTKLSGAASLILVCANVQFFANSIEVIYNVREHRAKV